MNLWLISKINICRIKIYSKCFKGHSFCAENFGAFFMNVMRGRQSSYYNFFKWSEKYFKLTLYKGRQITSINPTCICGNSSFRSRSIIAWKYKHRDNKLLFSAASIIPPLLHTQVPLTQYNLRNGQCHSCALCASLSIQFMSINTLYFKLYNKLIVRLTRMLL